MSEIKEEHCQKGVRTSLKSIFMCKCGRINNPNNLEPIGLDWVHYLIKVYNLNNSFGLKKYLNLTHAHPSVLWGTRTSIPFYGGWLIVLHFLCVCSIMKKTYSHLTTSCTEEARLYLPARIRGHAKIQEVLMPSTFGNNKPAEHKS